MLQPLECTSIADFEVGKTLGTGSFGRVKFATHTESKEHYALKMLRKTDTLTWDKYHDGEWEEMSLEQQSIIIAQQEGLQQFLDEAMEIRSTIDTIKSNLDGDDQFDREHALEFFKEEGCNPSALSKVMFEVDCREAKIKYESDSAAGRDMEKILTDIENEFGTNVFSWLKSGVEQSMAKAAYEDLIGNDKSPDDALAEIEASNKFSAGSISHLKSTVVERSEVMSLYNELKAKNNSHDACIAEIKASDKISVGSINWLIGTKNSLTTRSNAFKAVKSKTIKATKKQEDMVVKQKQGAANGLSSQHAAKAAVADPNRNASKRQQVIAKNVDEGRKKYSNTRKLNEDIKTLENGEEEDIVKLQCTKGCGDIRPYDSSKSSVHNQQVGQMFRFGDGGDGISCSCSGRHTSWELVCVDPDVASYLDNLKDQAEKMKAAQKAEKYKRERERQAAKKKAEKAAKLGGDNAANAKSSVDNKSTSSKATVGKRKSPEDKGKRKLSKADNVSSSVDGSDEQGPRLPRVLTAAPLLSIPSESVVPEAGMRVTMEFGCGIGNGLFYPGTIINVHPIHPTQPDVGLTVSIWLDNNTMKTYVEYPSVDIRFLRDSSLSIAFDRQLFPLDTD